MDTKHHIHYTKHHPGFGYAISLSSRVYSLVLAPLALLLVTFVALWALGKAPLFHAQALPPTLLSLAVLYSLARITIAYVLSLVVALPLALSVVHTNWASRVLLPVFDVLQSIPVTAFFPVLAALFVASGSLEGAAIVVLFLSMVWSLVFSLVGGFKVIPSDITAAAHVFGVRGMRYFFAVLLPSVVPYLVTGSLLAWAEGWNILIVAEVLHTYLPQNVHIPDLLGIGSLMVGASAQGQESLFMFLLIVLTVIIALMNFFIWQKLLRYAEKFRFD